MDIINLALGLSPIPGLGFAFSTFEAIYKHIQKAQANKEQLVVLQRQIAIVLTTVNKEYEAKRIVVESTRDAIVSLNSLLKEIQAFVTKETSSSFMRLLFMKDQSRQAIDMYQARLQATIQAFQISALVNIQNWQTEHDQARNADQRVLDDRLTSIQANQRQLIELFDSQKDSATAMMATLQRRIDDGSADPTEMKFFKKSLQHLVSMSGHSVEVKPWTISPFDIEFGSLIGIGGFGKVYRGTWNKMPVAIKVVKNAEEIAPRASAIQREVDTWSSLRHPHILQFLGANILDEQPFIVMPLVKHGNARDYLDKNPTCNRLNLIHQICLGLVYLHHKRIIHGDLKGVNVLIDEGERALLCDFGLSRIKTDINTRSKIDASSGVGSQNWMAPEMFKGSLPRMPADIYAFGMTVYELYTNEIPLGYISPVLIQKVIVEQNTRPQRPTLDEAPQLTDAVWTLTQQCWDANPENRPIASTVCERLETIKSIPSTLIDLDDPGEESHPRKKVETSRTERKPRNEERFRTHDGQRGHRDRDLHLPTPGLGFEGLFSLQSLGGSTPRSRSRNPSDPGSSPSSGGTQPQRPDVDKPSNPPSARQTVKYSSSPPVTSPPPYTNASDADWLDSPAGDSTTSSPAPGNSMSSLLTSILTIGVTMRKPFRRCMIMQNIANVTTMTLSRDGSSLVAGLASGHWEVWDVNQGSKSYPEGEMIYRPDLGGSITTVSYCQSKTPMFIAGLHNGNAAHHLVDIGFTANCTGNRSPILCITGRDKLVLAFNRNRQIVSWLTSFNHDTSKVRFTQVQGLENCTTSCGSFSPDGNKLFIGTSVGTVLVVDAQSGRPLREPLTRPDSGTPTPSILDSRSGGGSRSSHLDRSLSSGANVNSVRCKSLTISPDGKRILVGYSNGEIRLWDVARGTSSIMRHTPKTKQSIPNRSISLAFSPDGSRVAYPSLEQEKMIEVQDVSSGRIIASVKLQGAPDKRINCIEVTPNNKRLIVAFAESSEIMMWVWN